MGHEGGSSPCSEHHNGQHNGHHNGHHAGHDHACTTKACACGITLLICFCLTCAQPVHGLDHSCAGGACRSLAQADAEPASFVTWLGAEDPIEHILGLYAASGSTEDVGSWILDSTSTASDGVEMALEEDPHADHDHRRSLLDHAGHDHSEEDTVAETESEVDEHDHSEDTEEEAAADTADVAPITASVEEVDEHAGHDHEDGEETASRSYLDTMSMASLSVVGETEMETVQRALAFITACQIDANCDLGSPTEAEAERSSRAHFALKVGLALSFIGMTVIASFIPTLLMRLPTYNGLLSCLNAFSGAVFLTVGLTHLLPHVTEYEATANLDTDYPVGLAIVAMGFILVLFVEQVLFNVHGHKPEHRDDDELRSQDIPLLERTKGVARFYQEPLVTQLAVGLHAVLECITMGLALSRKDVLLLYAAICAHKVFTAMSLSTRFLRLGCNLKLLTILLLPFHLLPPLSVILAAAVGSDSPIASLIMVGLATGTFLYVGAFEVVCEEFAEHEDHDTHNHDHANKVARIDDSTQISTASQMMTNDADPKDHDVEEWRPSKPIKFAMFAGGVGLLLAITAGLPHHEH